MAYPPGVLTFTARFEIGDMEGAPSSAFVSCQIETRLVWAATGFIVDDHIKPKWTKNGIAEWELPYTDQSGFTDGFTGTPVINWGYHWFAQPTRSRPILPGSDVYSLVPQSKGPLVYVGNLVNIGAWPNSGGVITPPIVTGNYSAVETPPGSGAYVVTVT